MELVQIRYAPGGIEYRSRLATPVHDEGWQTCWYVSDDWGPWEKIDAIRGDESDKRFD